MKNPRWHAVEQNTDAWLALRLGKVTASNFALIMANDNGEKAGGAFGEPAKRYALQVALERITGERSQQAGFSNDNTERGHAQEPIARALYEAETFWTVSNGGFFDCGLYGDSPDGLIGRDGVLEIKSVLAATHYANFTRGDIDPAYKWQVAGHLDCSGRDWCDFVSYCADFPEGARLVVYRVDRDDMKTELARLAERRAAFLEYIETLTAKIPRGAICAE